MAYALSQSVSTVLIGCSTPGQVEQNVRAASGFQPLARSQLAQLEERVRPRAREYSYFKRHGGPG